MMTAVDRRQDGAGTMAGAGRLAVIGATTGLVTTAGGKDRPGNRVAVISAACV
jgi:hypothetical protein